MHHDDDGDYPPPPPHGVKQENGQYEYQDGDGKEEEKEKKPKKHKRSSSKKKKKKRSKSKHKDKERKRDRSRSRSRKHKSRRSRSRSSHKSRRRSRSRSRHREKPKPKFNPEAVQNVLSGIAAGGLPPNPSLMYSLPDNNAQLTRQCRRLYVGNLPVGMGLNEKILCEFFNTTVTSLGLQTPNPVLSVWLQTEGTFCFVEFRSVVDTTTCLTLLQGITIGGRALRVGRPAADYKPPPAGLENYVVGLPPGAWAQHASTGLNPNVSPLTGMGTGLTGGFTSGLPGLSGLPGTPSPVPSVPGSNFSSTPPSTPPPIPGQQLAQQLAQRIMPTPPVQFLTPPAPAACSHTPTHVLLLLNMVTDKELHDDDEFMDIVLDVREECEKFGPVEQVIIPRPLSDKKDDGDSSKIEGIGGDRGPRIGGGAVGRIFVIYRDSDSCSKAREALNNRMFNSRRVEAWFFKPDELQNRNYGA